MDLKDSIVFLSGLGDFEIVDTLKDKENEYALLVNCNNEEDIVLRKIVKDGENEYLECLGEAEFDNIIHEFIEKNKDLFE